MRFLIALLLAGCMGDNPLYDPAVAKLIAVAEVDAATNPDMQMSPMLPDLAIPADMMPGTDMTQPPDLEPIWDLSACRVVNAVCNTGDQCCSRSCVNSYCSG